MGTLTIYRGDTKKYQFTIKDVNGNPVDVRNHYLYFTVKADPAVEADNVAIIAVKEVLPNNAESEAGIAKITIPSTETDLLEPDAEYTYDFQYVVTGTPPYVQTIDSGKLKVKQDVTLSNT